MIYHDSSFISLVSCVNCWIYYMYTYSIDKFTIVLEFLYILLLHDTPDTLKACLRFGWHSNNEYMPFAFCWNIETSHYQRKRFIVTHLKKHSWIWVHYWSTTHNSCQVPILKQNSRWNSSHFLIKWNEPRYMCFVLRSYLIHFISYSIQEFCQYL